MSAKTPISVMSRNGYTPILHRYRVHIGPDIGEIAEIGEKTHDIDDVKKQVYTNIHRYRVNIGADISFVFTISCTNTPILGHEFFCVPISGYLVKVPDIGVPISGDSIIRYSVTLLSDIVLRYRVLIRYRHR
jgi:hypothetical protein